VPIRRSSWATLRTVCCRTVRDGRNADAVSCGSDEWEQVAKLLEKGADYTVIDRAGGTLAWGVHRTKVDPKSPDYRWVLKVREMLIARGVRLPPPSPKENRARLGIPDGK